MDSDPVKQPPHRADSKNRVHGTGTQFVHTVVVIRSRPPSCSGLDN